MNKKNKKIKKFKNLKEEEKKKFVRPHFNK
jgi:hypothetical protein